MVSIVPTFSFRTASMSAMRVLILSGDLQIWVRVGLGLDRGCSQELFLTVGECLKKYIF